MYPRLRAFPQPAMTDNLAEEALTPDTLPLHPPQAPPALQQEPQVLDEPSEAQQALAVRFEPPPGEPARSSMTLELRCDTPDAIIRYSIGADLDESSPIYQAGEPILLTRSGIITARAWSGGTEGPISSASYEIIQALWQQREPEDQSDAVAHQESCAFDFDDGWKACAASTRGKLHAHRALWREDSFSIAQASSSAGTWAILAVGDGAGSANLARVGSRLACHASVESLRLSLSEQELSEDIGLLKERDLPLLREKLVQSAQSALQVLEAEAEQRQKPLGDFATTLLLLVRCAWKNQHVCASLQVGDGAIALQNRDGLLTILGVADHGEHSSETRFLSTPGIEAELAERTRFSIRSGLSAVAVLSDGVSDDFFPEEKRLPEVFAQVLPLAQGAEGDAALLGWLGYEKKGSSDDRTIIVSWEPEPGAPSTCSTESGESAGEISGQGGVEDAASDGAA